MVKYMKNDLKYYYNLDVEHITNINNEYHFLYKSYSYVFCEINRTDKEITELYSLSNYLNNVKRIHCHIIIPNKDDNLITTIGYKKYILMKKNITSKELITLRDIIKFSDATLNEWDYKSLLRVEWGDLWKKKIDYFAYQISQYGKKYKEAISSFCYFEGVAENAIQAFEQYTYDVKILSVSHKRLEVITTLDDFYNPLNFIIDYRVRDVCEYLKSKIRLGIDVYDEIEFFLSGSLRQFEKYLLFVRMLFPSLQLDIYEDVFFGKIDVEEINKLLLNNLNYEKYIKKMYNLMKLYIDVPKIDWLN